MKDSRFRMDLACRLSERPPLAGAGHDHRPRRWQTARRRTLRACTVIALVLGGTGCATFSPEPPNLTLVKRQIVAYVDTGEYDRQIAAVASRAAQWLEQRAARRAPGERLTLVMDLDETLLSNLPYMRSHDFGYIPVLWDAWVDAATAPPIEPVREVYRTARRLELEVVFLTGRTERDRPGTERNLRAIGCGDYTALLCKPLEWKESTAAFKTGVRRQLAGDGHVIVANVGDQLSDLAGGFAERTFKLPAPFYLTE
jgi:hypothetical protein